MSSAPERLIDAQRALLETSQTIGRKGLEGAGQWLELNLQLARSLLSGSALPVAGMMAAPTLCGGGMPSSAQAHTEAITSYFPRLVEIVSGTQGEMARLMLQQATEMQSLFNEMLSPSFPNGPGGEGGLLAMMGGPLSTMQRAFTQAGRAAAPTAATAARATRAGPQGGEAGARPGKRSMQAEE